MSVADQPILRTLRLALRPFAAEDAPMVQRLAGAREIADTTLHIPHPYPDGAAEAWIASHRLAWESGNSASFAITDAASGALIGAVGLSIVAEHALAELGYWVAVPHWNRGYGTEAGRAVIALAFGELGLHRVQARHFLRNRASGRVMEKLGMRREGIFRDGMRRWGRFEDVEMRAILSSVAGAAE
ncbi:MAG: GNAT family N-acetyltransferase [Gemmatimonadaceae bacterium]